MAKPFDVSRFRKSISKSIDGLGIGFNDPTDWISTGNYALNYLISGDFNKGIPLGKVTVFAGESGAGKAQPLTAKVLTIDGWKFMKDVGIGDKVISPTGSISMVMAEHPQGKKDIYELSFRDGRKTYCCENHLWNVYKSKSMDIETVNFKELLARQNKNKQFIPLLTGDVGKNIDLPMDPYILGVLLGDGSITQAVSFCSYDQEIVQNVQSKLDKKCILNSKDNKHFYIRCSEGIVAGKKIGKAGIDQNPYKVILKNLGLYGKRSWEKSIPNDYKYSSFDQKLELIRGLLDTDGYCSKSGSTYFTTTSNQLALDVQNLIWSIGGEAILSARTDRTYLYKGERKPCRDSYTVSIKYRNPKSLVSLLRKKDLLRDNYHNGQYILKNRIENISLYSNEEAKCITLDSSDGLYLTDDYIVTHNSYICSGNVIKNAQEQGIFVILVDTENALDESWLKALGVDTNEDKLLKLSLCMIDDVAKTISEFMKEYKTMPEGERPKVLFVIDSLGMLLTPTDVNQFEAGEMKGDLGRKPKALTSLVRNCVNMFGSYGVGLVATNHTYGSMDPYNPDPIISGGQGFVYASSIVVAMKKMKLKEDEDGNKTTEVNGIRAGCKVMKTRYNQPFSDMQVHIPYDKGMSEYSGLFDLLEKRNLITKEGNRYSYIDLNGEVHKYFRKEWNKNENGILDLVMTEFHKKVAPTKSTIVDVNNDTESDVDE